MTIARGIFWFWVVLGLTLPLPLQRLDLYAFLLPLVAFVLWTRWVTRGRRTVAIGNYRVPVDPLLAINATFCLGLFSAGLIAAALTSA